MGLFSSFDVNASGLTAQRYRIDVISENIANINTTRTADGTPYRRKIVVFEEKPTRPNFKRVFDDHYRRLHDGKGVRVVRVSEDHSTDLIMAFDPAHPDADENGYVHYPNVNVVTEMTNLIDASRAYEANATAFNASKAMAMKGLEMAQ